MDGGGRGDLEAVRSFGRCPGQPPPGCAEVGRTVLSLSGANGNEAFYEVSLFLHWKIGCNVAQKERVMELWKEVSKKEKNSPNSGWVNDEVSVCWQRIAGPGEADSDQAAKSTARGGFTEGANSRLINTKRLSNKRPIAVGGQSGDLWRWEGPNAPPWVKSE
ncbi:Synaptotagmin-6 [Manis pentadactyla]|nr:Synaptotagmin-6 [Manis pentadactyla]